MAHGSRDGRRWLRVPEGHRLRWTLTGALAALLVASPFAVAAADHALKFGARNPAHGRSSKTTTLAVSNSTYGLKLDNSRRGGGGALFTCRAGAGGTADHHEPCIRGENRAAGFAFEFGFTGPIGGVFEIGDNINKPFPNARPFVTNATGVATGLNADRLDGLHAQEIVTAAVEQSAVQVGAQGPAGPLGPTGPKGAKGDQGVQGPPGTPLVASETTATNVTLPPVLLSSSEPTAGGSGVDLVPAVQVDPGTYVVSVTLRAFSAPAAGTTVGVATLFLGPTGVPSGTVTTSPTIDTNNPGTGSLTTTITVPAGGGTLSLQGVARSTVPLVVATGGADLVITQVNPTR